VHENRRYVKLALIGCAVAAGGLLFPAGAAAEIVSAGHGPAALAVRADGTSYVVYTDGCALHISRRTAAGWHDRLAVRCLALPPGGLQLAGARVDRRGRVAVLAHDISGSKIVLVRETAAGFRVQTVVRVTQAGSVLGAPGLALDAADSPVVAYVVHRPSRETFLRLVRIGRGGRLVSAAVTLRGFPRASLPPSATPVLVRGRVHVVETFAAEAIEWMPTGRRWLGQFLFASARGYGAGPVFAVAAGAATWTAATLLEPEFGESDVVLTRRADTETTSVVFTHAQAAGLAVAAGRPEVAANEAVAVGDEAVTAALIADETGAAAELDGRIDGYAVGNDGARQLLLSTDRGIEWFRSATRPSTVVVLAADATGALSGRVVGATSGTIDVYRERPGLAPTLVATAPLGPDGAFTAQVPQPAGPTLFRAVYRDPATDIPYASLTRTPVG
jgi:hypothetical protein